jgi:cytidine deaminase
VATNVSIEEFIVYTKVVEDNRLCKVVFREEFKQHELVKIWTSPNVQLACCHCRRFLEELVNCKKATWELLTWAKDIRLDTLKELGILTQSDLQKLKNKK